MSQVKPKTAFEELIEAVMEISKVTLPFLAARGDGGSNNMMLIVMMPLMMMLLRRIQTSIYTKIKPKTLIICESHRGDLTAIYKTVKNYLLLEYADKFDLTCGYNYLMDDEGDDTERQNMEESDIPSGIYYIVHKGATIDLEVTSNSTKGGDSYNTFKLSHKDKEVLLGFIKDARMSEKERVKPIVAKERHWLDVFNWNCQWISMQIRITKKRNNLFLEPRLDEALFGDIDKFLESEEQYLERGLVWKRGYLFYGTPGCGKTSTSLAIAAYTGRSIFRIKVNQILSSTEFDKACRRVDNGQIVVLEELDTIAMSRSQRKLTTDPEKLHALAAEFLTLSNIIHVEDTAIAYSEFVNYVLGKSDPKQGENAWAHAHMWNGNKWVYPCESTAKFADLVLTHLEREYPNLAVKYTEEVSKKDNSTFAGALTLGDILTALDGNDCFYGCIIIATTNYPDRIDAALKRPGRVDMECNFKPATADVIKAIYKAYMGREPRFTIPDDATITQSKLIHEYVLTYEHSPDVLDQKLQEYFAAQSSQDTQVVPTTAEVAPTVTIAPTAAQLRSLASSFDLITDSGASV
ncbi:AAA-ATPase [Faustovirus]|nr:AAA-ATPase [Faustovirus]QJX73314.1 AAA-ATPase [Faustovirus]